MKISKWEELNGVKNEQYEIARVDIDYIMIVELHKRAENCFLNPRRVSKDKILAILKLFGFDIEFIKPPKLSKREYHLVNYLPEDWWIARNEDMGIYAYKAEPKKISDGFLGSVFWQGMLLPINLFLFITPDRAWSVKELKELEVEGWK